MTRSVDTTWGICPRCKNGTPVEHTRLYGCKFDDLHDVPGGTALMARFVDEEEDVD